MFVNSNKIGITYFILEYLLEGLNYKERDETMDLVIFTIGFSIIVLGLILTIINIIRKEPLEKYKTIMSVGLILFFSAVLMDDPKTGKPIQRPRIEKIEDEEEEDIGNEIEEDQDEENDKEEVATNIKDGSIELVFAEANNDRVEKGTHVHLLARIETISGTKVLDEITISTKEDDGDGIYTLINYSNRDFAFNEGNLVNIWGTYQGKGEDGIPRIYGLHIEKADEILDETSPEELEEKEIQNTKLFNEIYYNIAYRQLGHGKDEIITRAKAESLFIEEDEEENSIIISDEAPDDKYKGDYVYIMFDDTHEGNPLTSAIYHHENENIEVSLTNVAIDGDPEYDLLKTHVVGEEDKDVESVEKQIEFLNTRKALQ